MAQNFSGLIKEAARDLNDLEPGYSHIRWTENDLLEYANDAFSQIAAIRPDLFVKTHEITLSPGTFQTLPPDCTKLFSLDGAVSSDGTLQKTKPSVADNDIGRWFANAPVCTPTFGSASGGSLASGYNVASFDIDKNDPRTFTVSPPVPATPPVKVRVRCVELPAMGSLNSSLPLDGRFHNAVLEWIRYRALLVDDESASSFARAQFHMQHFYQMLDRNKMAFDDLTKVRSNAVVAPQN